MKKNKQKQKKKTIINIAKAVLLAPLLSFIFTKSVRGNEFPPVVMYLAPPSPLEIFSAFVNFFSGIFLILSALMAVIFIVAKKRKSKKRWPKIILIILISLTVLLFVTKFALSFFQ